MLDPNFDYSHYSEKLLDEKLRELKFLNKELDEMLDSVIHDDNDQNDSFLSRSDQYEDNSFLDSSLSYYDSRPKVRIDPRLSYLLEGTTKAPKTLKPKKYKYVRTYEDSDTTSEDNYRVPRVNKAKLSYSVKIPSEMPPRAPRTHHAFYNLIKSATNASKPPVHQNKEPVHHRIPKHDHSPVHDHRQPRIKLSERVPSQARSRSASRNSNASQPTRSSKSASIANKPLYKPFGAYKPSNPAYLSTESLNSRSTSVERKLSKSVKSVKCSQDWVPTGKIKYSTSTSNLTKIDNELTKCQSLKEKKINEKILELEKNWKHVGRAGSVKASRSYPKEFSAPESDESPEKAKKKDGIDEKLLEMEKNWKPGGKMKYKDVPFESATAKKNETVKSDVEKDAKTLKKEQALREKERNWKPSGLKKDEAKPPVAVRDKKEAKIAMEHPQTCSTPLNSSHVEHDKNKRPLKKGDDGMGKRVWRSGRSGGAQHPNTWLPDAYKSVAKNIEELKKEPKESVVKRKPPKIKNEKVDNHDIIDEMTKEDEKKIQRNDGIDEADAEARQQAESDLKEKINEENFDDLPEENSEIEDKPKEIEAKEGDEAHVDNKEETKNDELSEHFSLDKSEKEENAVPANADKEEAATEENLLKDDNAVNEHNENEENDNGSKSALNDANDAKETNEDTKNNDENSILSQQNAGKNDEEQNKNENSHDEDDEDKVEENLFEGKDSGDEAEKSEKTETGPKNDSESEDNDENDEEGEDKENLWKMAEDEDDD